MTPPTKAIGSVRLFTMSVSIFDNFFLVSLFSSDLQLQCTNVIGSNKKLDAALASVMSSGYLVTEQVVCSKNKFHEFWVMRL